ncbi:MAG: glycerol-3-phosphate dehydrogenase/oxidase, partial [Planctomycetes bacterium]|nr:glycerol-3-phosphate dehydrogenase/oxidase [Planctomycetota bacterium]
EAALRGHSVLLVEARDVAAGTSSRSSQLVHGGLRYLQHGHFHLVREALHERERLLRSVPHLVRPLPMLLPFFRGVRPGPFTMRLGTWLYTLLAGRSTLPRPRALDADAARRAFPGLRGEGLRSGLVFFDAATQDARLTVANAVGAVEAGAKLTTHCRVAGRSGDGVRLVDAFTGAEIVVRSKHVVNAAGPAVDRVRAAFGVEGAPLVRTTRGSHLVLPARPGEQALAAFLPDGRIQFVIPHDGGTLCGTTDVDDAFPDQETGPPADDVDYLLAALRHLLEPAPTRADVQFAYAGWRALPAGKGPPGKANREAFVVDERLAIAGATLHTIVGGKLTTHRALAERIVGALFGHSSPSPSRTQPLPGGDGPREVTEPLWWRHGGRIDRVRAALRERPELATPLCPHRPFLAVEVQHAVEHEAACTFADVMLRRLCDLRGPCLEPECLRAAHAHFLRARRWPVDDDPATAIAALVTEVDASCGGIRPGSR